MKSKKCGAKPSPKHIRPEEEGFEACELILLVKPAGRRYHFQYDVVASYSRPGTDPIRHEVATDQDLDKPIAFVRAGAMLCFGGWVKTGERLPTFSESEITLESFPILALNARFGIVQVYRRPILDGRPPDEPRIDLEAFNRFLRLGGKPNGND